MNCTELCSGSHGIYKYGDRAFSPSIVKRLEHKTGLNVECDGFPERIEDYDEESLGYEVVLKN